MRTSANCKSFLLPILILSIGIVSISIFSSFKITNAHFANFKNYIDTSGVVLITKVKLGKSGFFILKPSDCVENVLREVDYESDYIIYPRVKKPHHLDGFCSITIDRNSTAPITHQVGETTFQDSIMGRKMIVREYNKAIDIKNVAKGNAIDREGEFTIGTTIFHFQCEGYSKEELEKYYAIAKSISK